jgi:hypothetical protein
MLPVWVAVEKRDTLSSRKRSHHLVSGGRDSLAAEAGLWENAEFPSDDTKT